MQASYTRHTARKTTIGAIISGEYITEEEGQANFLLTTKQEKLYRVNIIAIILSIAKNGSTTSVLLDDGSGQILARVFEEHKRLEELNVGDIALCIARVRVFNQEKYLAPEILKVVEKEWLELRALELKQDKEEQKEEEIQVDKEKHQAAVQEPALHSEQLHTEQEAKKEDEKITVETIEIENKDEISEVKEEINQSLENLGQKVQLNELIREKIKELDQGNGVAIEELIDLLNNSETEKAIERMLEMGEIFQNLPGKVKIL